MTRINMTGKRFGRLTAIEVVGPSKGGLIWRFRCDCGRITETSGYHVRAGRIASCGCYGIEQSRARATAMPRETEPLHVRFWHHVEETSGGCWQWTGSLNKKGYGQVYLGGRTQRRMGAAHRVAYELLVGEIPNGLELDHLCRNRRCVNPWHLDPVTGAENMRRMALARTHCRRGHAWTEENTYRTPHGRRQCRVCINIRKARGRKAAA